MFPLPRTDTHLVLLYIPSMGMAHRSGHRIDHTAVSHRTEGRIGRRGSGAVPRRAVGGTGHAGTRQWSRRPGPRLPARSFFPVAPFAQLAAPAVGKRI
jgi:hypothetical protein